ncbi:Insulin-degrading enzyme [Geodia barretti]|uniref:Insulin-degrading enzyme n=1 Tax=Geodia barretti TaxID=519541 RepID=A0AA35QUK5_GEOBA|nr:Insulin-degrading enzyme [Geodia barretti]
MSPNVGDSLCQHTAHLRDFKTLLSEIELCVPHRFAQFFQSPLFNASATDREVKAVDSENDRNLQEDAWRIQQVLRHLSKHDHPHRKFGTGNSATLDRRPRELDLDVREELRKFHSGHYSSNLMRLAVIGREDLDELTSLVEELFSPVLNKNKPVPVFPDHPYSPEDLQLWIECVPVKELRQLMIEFPIPDLHDYYYCDPILYVSHLIGHEGGGSLFAHLKSKGWCNTLTAGPTAGAKGYSFFAVRMVLSSQGEGTGL